MQLLYRNAFRDRGSSLQKDKHVREGIGREAKWQPNQARSNGQKWQVGWTKKKKQIGQAKNDGEAGGQISGWLFQQNQGKTHKKEKKIGMTPQVYKKECKFATSKQETKKKKRVTANVEFERA